MENRTKITIELIQFILGVIEAIIAIKILTLIPFHANSASSIDVAVSITHPIWFAILLAVLAVINIATSVVIKKLK